MSIASARPETVRRANGVANAEGAKAAKAAGAVRASDNLIAVAASATIPRRATTAATGDPESVSGEEDDSRGGFEAGSSYD